MACGSTIENIRLATGIPADHDWHGEGDGHEVCDLCGLPIVLSTSCSLDLLLTRPGEDDNEVLADSWGLVQCHFTCLRERSDEAVQQLGAYLPEIQILLKKEKLVSSSGRPSSSLPGRPPLAPLDGSRDQCPVCGRSFSEDGCREAWLVSSVNYAMPRTTEYDDGSRGLEMGHGISLAGACGDCVPLLLAYLEQATTDPFSRPGLQLLHMLGERLTLLEEDLIL